MEENISPEAQEKDFKDKRKLRRRHLIYYLRVFNKQSDKLVGHLVDITTEGIMLMSEAPVGTNMLYHLRMDVPEEIFPAKVIQFDARSIWCRKDVNPDFYVAGFQLEHVEQSTLYLIEDLINDFGFKDDN